MPANEKGRPKIKAQWGRASDIEIRPVDWLWPGYFARGKVSLIVGDPGLSKSMLLLYFAARVTRGDEWTESYGGSGKPASVLLLSAEDDASDTIVPRAMAAGADTDKLYIMGMVQQSEPSKEPIEREFNLATDLSVLRQKLDELKDVALLIIDPLAAYQPGVNSDKNSEVRVSLNGLKRLAEKYNIAIVALMHLNKAQVSAIYRVSGSMGYVAMARAVYLVVENRKSIDPYSRLFLPIKTNLGPPSNGLVYQLVPRQVGEGIEMMAIEFTGMSGNISVDEALAPPPVTRARNPAGEQLGVAVKFLRTILGDGDKLEADVREAAIANDITPATLKRARAELGVEAYKTKASLKGGWRLRLPPSATPDNQNDAQPRKDGPALKLVTKRRKYER